MKHPFIARSLASLVARPLPLAATALLALMIGTGLYLRSTDVMPTTGLADTAEKMAKDAADARIQEAAIARLRATAEEAKQQLQKEGAEIRREAAAQIQAILNAANAAAPQAGAASAVGLTGFRNTFRLTYFHAKDILFSSGDLQEYTVRALAPSLDLLVDTAGKLQAVIDGHHQRLVAADTAYRAKILKMGETLELSPSTIGMVDFHDQSTALQNLVQKNLGSIVSAGFEAILIKSTIHAILKLVGGIAARQASTLAVCGGIAVADGPLPIGDAIAALVAAGGTAWTAWEIYDAAKANIQLPDKLTQTLLAQLAQLQKETTTALQQLDSTFL